MNNKNNNKRKLKFVCPHCGKENSLEEVQSINELNIPITGATENKDGEIDFEYGEPELDYCEVIDVYYRCSSCLELILDPALYFIKDK